MAEHKQFEGFYVPNSTQVPDDIFDVWMPVLSGAELKVLMYIARRTLGFKKQRDAISISQMVHGITKRTGEVLDKGTGLSRASAISAAKSLEEQGLIVRNKQHSAAKGDEATTYSLKIVAVPEKKATLPVGQLPNPLVDLDQQASATRNLGLDPENENPNLYHVFKRQVPAATAVKELAFGFHIIPGNTLLAAIEEALEEGDETLLRSLITGVKDQYDYILLDSPPGKAMLAISALSAADEVIIPLPAERPALDGVQDLLRFISEIVWEKHNNALKIRGILPTMYKKTTTHAPGVVEKAREIWGDKVFPVQIPETIAFPRAYNEGKPLLYVEPDHEGAQAYMALARLIHPHHERN